MAYDPWNRLDGYLANRARYEAMYAANRARVEAMYDANRARVNAMYDANRASRDSVFRNDPFFNKPSRLPSSISRSPVREYGKAVDRDPAATLKATAAKSAYNATQKKQADAYEAARKAQEDAYNSKFSAYQTKQNAAQAKKDQIAAEKKRAAEADADARRRASGLYGTTYGSNNYGTTYGSNNYGTTYGSNNYGTTYGSNNYGTTYGSNNYGTTYGSNNYGNNYVGGSYGNNYVGGNYGNNYSSSRKSPSSSSKSSKSRSTRNRASNSNLDNTASSRAGSSVSGTDSSRNIPGTDSSRNIPGTDYSRSIPGTDYSRSIPGTDYSRNFPGTSDFDSNAPELDLDEDGRFTGRYVAPAQQSVQSLPRYVAPTLSVDWDNVYTPPAQRSVQSLPRYVAPTLSVDWDNVYTPPAQRSVQSLPRYVSPVDRDAEEEAAANKKALAASKGPGAINWSSNAQEERDAYYQALDDIEQEAADEAAANKKALAASKGPGAVNWSSNAQEERDAYYQALKDIEQEAADKVAANKKALAASRGPGAINWSSNAQEERDAYYQSLKDAEQEKADEVAANKKAVAASKGPAAINWSSNAQEERDAYYQSLKDAEQEKADEVAANKKAVAASKGPAAINWSSNAQAERDKYYKAVEEAKAAAAAPAAAKAAAAAEAAQPWRPPSNTPAPMSNYDKMMLRYSQQNPAPRVYTPPPPPEPILEVDWDNIGNSYNNEEDPAPEDNYSDDLPPGYDDPLPILRPNWDNLDEDPKNPNILTVDWDNLDSAPKNPNVLNVDWNNRDEDGYLVGGPPRVDWQKVSDFYNDRDDEGYSPGTNPNKPMYVPPVSDFYVNPPVVVAPPKPPVVTPPVVEPPVTPPVVTPPVEPPAVNPPVVAPPKPPVVEPPVVKPPVVEPPKPPVTPPPPAPPVTPPTPAPGIPVTLASGPGLLGSKPITGGGNPPPPFTGTPVPPITPPFGTGVPIYRNERNVFDDEAMQRDIYRTLPITPPPIYPPQVTPVRPPVTMGSGSLDPHTLGSYKKLSDTFGTARDRMGNAIAAADMPSIDEIREGQLTAQIAGTNSQLSDVLGYKLDRFGNTIAAPAMPAFFNEGGEATSISTADFLAQEQGNDSAINTDLMGSAQKFLSDMAGAANKPSPTRLSTKRGSRTTGGAESSKEMNLKLDPLTDSKLMTLDTSSSSDKVKDTRTAREQMQDLAQLYQLKARAAKNKSKGLGADTFGAATLEGAALTKDTLGKKRFAEGGEVNAEDKPSALKLLRRLGLSVARGVPQALTGMVDLASLPLTATGKMKAEDIVGTTDFLTKRGLLPKPQEGVANESAELLSSMASPGGAAKAAMIGMLGPKGIIEAARRSQLFKGKGLAVPDENFSAQEMMKMLREQGVDTERTWLRGKKGTDAGKPGPHYNQGTLEYLYEYQKRPDAIEAALRDSRMSQAQDGRTLSRQPGDRGVTKFNTKGGVWLTESPSLAQTYAGDKGFTIPVYAPKPDAVVDAKGEQWSDFYRKDKDWKEAFEDPNIRLVEVKNVIDAGPNWSSMISPEASEEELRALLTATNLFAKKPFDKRVVNKLTGEPYEFKRGGAVKKSKK